MKKILKKTSLLLSTFLLIGCVLPQEGTTSINSNDIPSCSEADTSGKSPAGTGDKYLTFKPVISGEEGNRSFKVNNSQKIIRENEYYTSIDDLGAYIMTLKKLPSNYVILREEEVTGTSEYPGARDTCFKTYASKCRLYNIPYHNNGKYSSPLLIDGAKNYIEADIGEDSVYITNKIVRGPLRIVFSLDVNKEILYYTDDHYENYSQYLNYEGGWGSWWGNGPDKKNGKHPGPFPWVKPSNVSSLD